MRQQANAEHVFDRERRLLTRFRQRSLPYWPLGYPQNDWEHLFAMQHHGAPTRLLDWSENLFVALYFSLSASPPGDHQGTTHPEHPCRPAVWLLDPRKWNQKVPQLRDLDVSVLTTADEELEPYQPAATADRFRKRQKTPVALWGTHNSARIVAQRGAFTIAGGECQPMEHYAKQEGLGEALWKLELQGDRAALLRDLGWLGFSESMVYPDLIGLARELEQSEV